MLEDRQANEMDVRLTGIVSGIEKRMYRNTINERGLSIQSSPGPILQL